MASLAVGTKAPDFKLTSTAGKEVSLADSQGKNVVLAFYPLDWSPVCSNQMPSYQKEIGKFEKLGAAVVGISTDSPYSHQAWAEKHGIKYPLLSDWNPLGQVAKQYGVLHQSGRFSERAIFIIGKDGTIKYSYVSDIRQPPDTNAIFAQLEKLK